jgi:hypothetical protein
VGNKILEPNNLQFVPYGFVVYCLAERTLTCNDPTSSDPVTDSVRIQDAASYWHANVVRIQVAEENLFQGSGVNATVMGVLQQEVHLANSLGMVAIITQQEEQYQGPPLPTAASVQFWSVVANTFKGNQRVFFDLYNEPRLKPSGTNPAHGEDWMWNIWRNGGAATKQGRFYHFVGMQTLVNDIRGEGAHNIIIAEGNQGDHDLSGIPQYALQGSNIAYGMEPDLLPNDRVPAQWAANWGNLSNSVPIMMEAFQDYPGAGSCDPGSPVDLPELLTYLHSKDLGLISWALNPGVMMVGDNPEHPTSYEGTNVQLCASGRLAGAGKGRALETNINGPGMIILNYFRANSEPAPEAGTALQPSGLTSVGTSGTAVTTIVVVVVLAAFLLVIGTFVVARRRSRRVHGS